MNNKPELAMEIPDLKEFLKKFAEIAEVKYTELGLAGYIAIVSRDSDGIFQAVAQSVNAAYGRHGWTAGVDEPINKAIATITGIKTRDIINAVPLNDSCVICSSSDDTKGYPEKNDERDRDIVMSVLEEISLE